MKNTILEIKVPVNYALKDIENVIKKKGISNIKSIEIIRKSLDARKKKNIIWNLKVRVNAPVSDYKTIRDRALEIPYKKRDKKIVIIGSGPSGIFSALVLLKAGFKVTLMEKGSIIPERDKEIELLDNKGIFNPESNYAFGEGGAGTYSDGKLTSRSKHISKEKDYILSTYITHGAPKEIFSLVHPHVGSDNLKKVCKGMREEFLANGGELLFNTSFLSFSQSDGKVTSVKSSAGEHYCDYLIMATGHSSFETYRELIKKGVLFQSKNFAIGFRAEHPQALINNAQWGCDQLEGIKAAEYRLTAKSETTAVYSFCMCPGGTIVPAAAMKNTSVVNGMSYYNRDGEFANAAIVAGFNYSRDLNREVDPLEILERLQNLEESYYTATGGFRVPAMKITDFINNTDKGILGDTSYPLGLEQMNMKELLPKSVIKPLQHGLEQFSRKLKGYESGTILGLESKTSAPIQVLREREGLCNGYENLYFVGEGSGWAGGIISSGADGIKGALDIIKKES